MFYRKLLRRKRILKASQTWKLPISIFIRWKVLRHSMRRFCNEFLEIRKLCWMCTTFLKSWILAHAHYEASTMRLVLWGLHHVQGLNFHQLRQPNHHILQRLRRCTRLYPFYLLVTIVAILPTKLVNATSFPRISFVIIVGKKDIRKLSVLPNSRNKSNLDYHNKICQHLPLPLNQKPRHLSLQLRLSPPKVILVRMLRRRSTMLTRRRCFKPMLFKFKLCRMNSNHWGPNLLISKSSLPIQLIKPNLYMVQDHEKDLLGHSMAFHKMPWLGSMFFPMHIIQVSHQNLLFLFALVTSRHKRLVWHSKFLPLGR
jgi:hypothetical protein